MPVGAMAGAGIAGAGAQMFGASQAANAQQQAAQAAIAAQKEMQQKALDQQQRFFDITQNNLAPFIASGTTGANYINNNLPSLIAPIHMDQATLEQTPGYQFALQQGLKSTQNQLTSSGLGNSGAAVKAAARYATGLADNTYKTQFDIANTNASNTWNRLLGLTQTGGNAAAGLGNAATQTGANIGNQAVQTGTNIGNALIGAGNAQAAGYNAMGAAAANGLNTVGMYPFMQQLMQNRYGSGAPLTSFDYGGQSWPSY